MVIRLGSMLYMCTVCDRVTWMSGGLVNINE